MKHTLKRAVDGNKSSVLRTAFLFGIVSIILLVAFQPIFAADQGGVLIVKISGDIASPTAELVSRSIQEAEAVSA